MNAASHFQPYFIREKMIHDMRIFFRERHFHEVIVPALNTAVPTEPTIHPFTTTWSNNENNQTLYLSTSPERYVKKMLAQGFENCFAIGHAFRNLESCGPYHHPEFLMLEWYRKNATSTQIMDDLELLVQAITQAHTIHYQGNTHKINAPFPRVSLESLFMQHVGFSISEILTDTTMCHCAQKFGYSTKNATWEQLFYQLMLNLIEPHFSKEPFFLIDFPARISPLCKRNTIKPFLADRFEFFIAGIEMANGNTEETDRARILQSFQDEFDSRKKMKHISSPLDEEFLKSLDVLNNTPCAGVGLGVDRFAMILADATDIHAFHFDF